MHISYVDIDCFRNIYINYSTVSKVYRHWEYLTNFHKYINGSCEEIKGVCGK